MTKNNFILAFLILIVNLTLSESSFAQFTKIKGIVIDSIRTEPLPFVNIQLIGTTLGTTSSFDGSFSLTTDKKVDSLLISYIGYQPVKIKIKSKAYQELIIKLQQSKIELSEVTIRPTENPAHPILRKIIANKALNDLYQLDAYECKVYNKVQIDANNITEKFKNRRTLKPFEFIFENIDTSTINGKSYLPLMISETLSEYYFRKKPMATKELILASRVSGINNTSVSQYMGNMYQNINIYDNYFSLFNVNFVSPIADFGLRSYRYYLVDSAFRDGSWCYQIMFKPKRIQEPVFTGEMWVADTSFAIKDINMRIDKVNLNFVDALSIDQQFEKVDSNQWFLSRDNIIIDFNVVERSKQVTGFYGHKTTLYKDVKIKQARPDENYSTKVAVLMDEKSIQKNDEFWDTTRFEELSKEEATIYEMVDTIVDLPAFKNIYDLIAMVATGYYNTKLIDLGPYFTTYSFNAVEGHRFRIGGRTSNQWNDKYRLSGHLAYGTLDQTFKYNLAGLFMIDNDPRRTIEVSYKKDMEQLGESVRALQQDNIVSSIFRSSPNNSLSMVEQYKAAFEYEYFNGFSNTLTFTKRQVYPLQDQQFEIFKNGSTNPPTLYKSLLTSEIELKTHFAYKEMFLTDKFNRTSFGSDYPQINLWYAYGIPNFLNSQFSYHKLQISVSQWFNIGTIGYSKYIISWGKIWGNLPYPILEVHPGNETFSYDDYAFNRMNYYEFISDEYFMGNYTHHFKGLFFNHIPLIRKLKWREVIYGKVLIGNLSPQNRDYSTFPTNTSPLVKPYYEVGVGIENIFKFIRIDASWRLSYLDKADVRPFGIMASMQFDF